MPLLHRCDEARCELNPNGIPWPIKIGGEIRPEGPERDYGSFSAWNPFMGIFITEAAAVALEKARGWR